MAVEMREAITNLSSAWRKRRYDLGFGVGIAQGYATLGRIDFEGRFDHAAVGSVVNLAASLCPEAADGHILVDSRVQAAVESLTATEPVGQLALKGMRRPLSAFNVLY